MRLNIHSDRSGSAAVTLALALIPFTLAVGAAVDYSRANVAKSELQGALDAAVLAAAAPADTSDSQRMALGKTYFTSISTMPPPSFAISNGIVTGTATYSMQTSFIGIVGQPTLDISATAQARVSGGASPCILLLEPKQIGLTINSQSQLNADCGIHVNSTNSEAIFANSQSKIVASDVCVTGKFRLDSGSTSNPTPKSNCPVKPDPLASLPEPPIGSCNFSDLVVANGQSRTLSPGVYCKKLEIQNGATVNFLPGTYVFPDAELIVNANGKLTGEGVMLFFKGPNGYLNANSGGRVQLKAPTSGIYKGIVLFQSRANSSMATPPFIVNSDSTSYFQGMIYLSNGNLMLNSNSTLNQFAAYTAVIARTMEINSFGTFTANDDFNNEAPLPNNINSFSSAGPILIK